jgi:signal transduction histidine kinase
VSGDAENADAADPATGRRRRTSLRRRWITVFAGMLSLTVLSGAVGTVAVTQITERFAALVGTVEADTALARELRTAISYQERLARDVLVGHHDLGAAFLGADDEVRQLFDRAGQRYRDPADLALLEDARQRWQDTFTVTREVAIEPERLTVFAPTTGARVTLQYGLQAAALTLLETLEKLDQQFRARVAAELDAAYADRTRIIAAYGTIAALSAGVLLVAARRLSREVLTPIKAIAVAVDRYADDELSHRIVLPNIERLGELGELADRCNTMADAIARIEAELEAANRELRSTVREQAAVSALSQQALWVQDPRHIMTEASDIVATTLGVDRAGVFQPDDGQHGERQDETHGAANGSGARAPGLLLRAGSGWDDAVGSLRVPADDSTVVGMSLTADVAVSGEPAQMPEPGLVAGACVAVIGGGTHLGVLGVFSASRRVFTSEELVFLHSVAFVVASAIYQQQAHAELEQAHKLEAVGRLAAGVAHEINTPMQFIADNLRFIDRALTSLDQALTEYQRRAAPGAVHTAEDRDALLRLEEELDLEFLRDETPLAARQALDGATRVAQIVKAMKAFSHQGSGDPEPADLNESLRNALTMAANEIKPCADVETDFRDLPLVVCHEGELNQVFLNLLINAAHAVADVVESTGQRGRIRVTTAAEPAGQVTIRISDSGTGIPEEVKAKIFDPFFTTKGVGRGTGQGLYLARTTIDRHHGSIGFTTAPGGGTTFTIRLPVAPA